MQETHQGAWGWIMVVWWDAEIISFPYTPRLDGRSKRQARYVCMTRKSTEWPFENGQTERVGPSDGCRGNAVPLAAESKYDFRELGAYLGNVG